MRKKINDKELENNILELLSTEYRSMSTREIKKKLEERFEIKRSPQIILRHLKNLEKTKKIIEENGKKI